MREVYAAIDDGRLQGRWVNPDLQVEVAVDDSSATRLKGPPPEHRR